MIEGVFWASAIATVYSYAGYPLALLALTARRPLPFGPKDEPRPYPSVAILIPAHNEEATIGAKVENCRRLHYPGTLRMVFVSDGSTDRTEEIIRTGLDERMELLVLNQRGGKAGALNAALTRVTEDLVVFSDASIQLNEDAIVEIVRPFTNPTIGCVSGEDRVPGGEGEGLYGRYELMIRRLESRLHSIVGASGSFYAQRRPLCSPFIPSLAPDFLSVLNTVRAGYRAVAQPDAVGTMTALSDPRQEFGRKVRTILRGITTLMRFPGLMNPFRYPVFAFELVSHKLTRWLVPFFLIAALLTNLILSADSRFYQLLLAIQVLFYLSAAMAFSGSSIGSFWPARISLYFASANVATLLAWLKFAAGGRQEIWSPSKRRGQ